MFLQGSSSQTRWGKVMPSIPFGGYLPSIYIVDMSTMWNNQLSLTLSVSNTIGRLHLQLSLHRSFTWIKVNTVQSEWPRCVWFWLLRCHTPALEISKCPIFCQLFWRKSELILTVAINWKPCPLPKIFKWKLIPNLGFVVQRILLLVLI